MNRKEYTVINLIAEYEGRIAEFKYAVSSALPEEKLRKKYGTELKRYEPFLYLTADQGQAIMESIRNNDKHLKRQKNTYDYFGYSDGATELRHVESIYLQSIDSDPLDKLITEENEREWCYSALCIAPISIFSVRINEVPTSNNLTHSCQNN